MYSATSYSDAYKALSPVAQYCALVCGVFHPHHVAMTKLVETLAFAGLRTERKRINSAQVRAAVKELANAEIVVVDQSGAGGNIDESWAPWLTMEANRSGKLEKLRDALKHGYGYWSYYRSPETRAIDVRCLSVLGRFKELTDNYPDVNADDWRFLAEPGAIALLPNVPARRLPAALSGCLSQVIDSFAEPGPVIDACKQLAPDLALCLSEIAFIRMLQGRLDEAGSIFDEMERDPRELHRSKIEVLGGRAFIATLRGDDDRAAAYIDAAVAEEKKGTRKRNVFPASRAFALSSLSLLRRNSPASLTLLEQLVRAADRNGAEPYIMSLVAAAAGMEYRQPVNSRYYGKSPLYLFLFELSTRWKGGRDLLNPKLLTQVRRRARLHGFNWVEAECIELVSEHKGGPDARQQGALSGANHADLGTVSLVSLVEPAPEWEQGLKEMERFAYELQGKRKPGPKKSRSKAPQRLAWDFEANKYDGIVLTPRLQRANKEGAWSMGRTLTPKQLLTQASTMDFLLEQDRAAISTIKQEKHKWRGQKRFYLPLDGLYALAGHPHVYRAGGEPVDIVRREPELSVDETSKDRIIVHIKPRGKDAVESGYHVRAVGKNGCEITHFTAGHKRLLDIIPPKGLELPSSARERLLQAVAGLTTEVRVQGAINEAADTVTQVTADPQPWVKLEPKGAGLSVELAVEPVPGTAIYMKPGQDGSTVFANRKGETVQTRRDLKAERAAVEALITACPSLAALAGARSALTLPEPPDCLELLEQVHSAGARCLWPGEERFKIAGRAGPKSLKVNIKSAAEWFRASGRLDLDHGRTLELRRLFALLDNQPDSRFLQLEDGAFIALTASFRRQLDDLRSLSAPAAEGSVRFHSMAAPALQDFLEQTALEAGAGWQKLRARLQDAQGIEPALPSTLQAELRPYQLEGFHWLARLSHWGAGACLADDMGLGKTVQALALLLQRAPAGPALVVAPTSVCANWVRETRRFAPTLNIISYAGAGSARAKLLEALGPFDLVITTYGLLQVDADALTQVQWHSAVLDEAQAIRNAATKRAQAARRIKAGFRLVTTGTPIQNNLMDLYSLFSFINPGLLGSQEQYRRHFALPVEKDSDADARARLRRLIAPFVLRRLKTEVLDDLPERTEIILHVEMSAEEAAIYEALRQQAVEELDSMGRETANQGERKLQVLAHLTRLRLACCNPRLVMDTGAPSSSKMELFADTLDELLAGRHKTLVFSQFVKHLKLVEEYLVKTGVSYQYLDGSTPARLREKRISAFQAGDGDVFLISLKAGGVGLNLTAADYVIHLDPWWNPAAEDQASDRAHRIGQTRPVTIYRLVTQGAIEEQIVELHHHKRDLADRLLEGADAPSRLNAEELLNLLRQPLNPPA